MEKENVEKVEKYDLLELELHGSSVENARLRLALLERDMREKERAFREKYALGPEDTVNAQTLEIQRKK